MSALEDAFATAAYTAWSADPFTVFGGPPIVMVLQNLNEDTRCKLARKPLTRSLSRARTEKRTHVSAQSTHTCTHTIMHAQRQRSKRTHARACSRIQTYVHAAPGYVVEARKEEEMPEVMACSCKLMRIDPTKAARFPPE